METTTGSRHRQFSAVGYVICDNIKQKSHATKTTKVNPGNQSQLQYMPIHAAGKLSVGTPFWPLSVSQYLSTTLFSTTQSAVEDSQLNKSRMNSSGS